MDKQFKEAGRHLSLILRHQPESIGLRLDEFGWASIDEIATLTADAELPLTRALILRLVAENDKRRYLMSDDGERVRANQGHSVQVDLGLEGVQPPEYLFHGTTMAAVPAIRAEGISRMTRQHVHLSADEETATRVGSRHGESTVLRILAGDMSRDGKVFFRSANGVWLIDDVPVQYIVFPPEP